MKRKIARIGPPGAAVAAVVGSAVLSLLILGPAPQALLPGTAPASLGQAEALLLPAPRVVHSLVHQVQSSSATTSSSNAEASSPLQTPGPAHHPRSAHARKSATRAPAAAKPADASHVPGSEHHGKPAWAAHPHGADAAKAHPTHPLHPAHPAHPANGGKKTSAHG
jgi:hypothetical protein